MRDIISPISGFRTFYGPQTSGLALYAVLSFSPEFAADFVLERYFKNSDRSTFADAITHTRASTATYVDENGVLQTAAINEPRVGHHVWNGSAWVNEGLLHESEARTNLCALSQRWVGAGWTQGPNTSISANFDTPFGIEAATITLSSFTGFYYYTATVSAETVYTASWWVKDRSLTDLPIYGFYDESNLAWIVRAQYTITDGQDYGDGWYRVNLTVTTPAGCTSLRVYPTRGTTDAQSISGAADFGGLQLEAGPTPSSYIPTSGSTVTRAADVLTIPSANLPWPEPVVIGGELVTNGTFDTDTSGWTGVNANLLINDQRLELENAGALQASTYQRVTTEVGKVYKATIDVTVVPSEGNPIVRLGTSINSTSYYSASHSSNKAVEIVFTATTTATFWTLYSGSSTAGYSAIFDNISVREINPLAVSIQMDGRVTYADQDENPAHRFVQWLADSSNRINHFFFTTSGTGGVSIQQLNAGVFDGSTSGGSVYAAGVLVPFSIAGRHGSNFVQGAVDGTALTADTTPVALPDLSATDLSLGNDYMGTIKTFRVWANDIGDAGIAGVTA